MSGVPPGFEPTDAEGVFEFNPDAFVRSPEQQALVDEAIRATRELAAIPPEDRDHVADPAKYALPVGILTDDEERERARRRRESDE